MLKKSITTDPIISYVLPSYNRERILRSVLLKLESISENLNCEIIVIDNA